MTVSGKALDFSATLNDQWAVTFSHYSTEKTRTRIYDPISVIFRPSRAFSQEFTSVGALYHRPILEQVDLLASLELGQWEYWFLNDGVWYLNNNQDENGYRFAVGAKSKFFGSLEAGLLVRQFKFLNPDAYTEDTITDTVIEGNYYFLEHYHLGGSLIQNDHSDRFVLNIGYSF
ncbi:MAG TPA: hypothetical protein VFX02_02390 [Gammaproteobacteria bacterium]|nr:hypothetical protein [Gammaproteobacteria bacterium]